MDPIDALRSDLAALAERLKALEAGVEAAAHEKTRALVTALAADLGALRKDVLGEISGAKAHVTAMVREWRTPAATLLIGLALGAATLAAAQHFW